MPDKPNQKPQQPEPPPQPIQTEATITQPSSVTTTWPGTTSSNVSVTDGTSQQATPQQPAGGSEPPAAVTPESWDAWLATQPEAVRELATSHISGLKSALDKERAQRKEFEKAQKRLAELEAAETKRQEAELSEMDKLRNQIAELQKQHTQTLTEMGEARIKAAVSVKALELGFHSPDDAYNLIDLAQVEIGEDGKVGGVDEALKALSESRPYLIKPAQKQAPKVQPTNPASTGETPGETDAQRRQRLYGGVNTFYNPEVARQRGGGVLIGEDNPKQQPG